MSKVFKIRKGLDIKLKGAANVNDIRVFKPTLYAVELERLRLFNPRLLVKEGDVVECGTPIIQNKLDERIFLTSPVSGVVQKIKRGEKRKLLAVEILADEKNKKIDFGKEAIDLLSREKIIEKLLVSGLWVLIRQRPYAIIANPDDTPRDIFISAINSAPLSVSDDPFIKKHIKEFQAGIDVLKKLTDGNVHIGIHQEKSDKQMYEAFKNVELHLFKGPHPVGNVGVQIHHVAPINKGEKIWYLSLQDVVAVGNLFNEGYRDISRFVTLAGSELKETYMLEMPAEASIKEIVSENIKQENVRVISGNVLTGTNVGKDGFLGLYDSMITVIPEGDEHEILGWMAPGFNKHSASRTFPAFLLPRKKYRLNTNYHGGNRAFVFGSQYEDVFPFDILPVYLIKAILAGDIEKMENLGIYEVVEEDFALCEYVCTSKMELQQIMQDGIDLMIKEMS